MEWRFGICIENFTENRWYALRGQIRWKDAGYLGKEFRDQPTRQGSRAVDPQELLTLNPNVRGHKGAYGNRKILSTALRERSSPLLAVNNQRCSATATFGGLDFEDSQGGVWITGSRTADGSESGVAGKSQDEGVREQGLIAV